MNRSRQTLFIPSLILLASGLPAQNKNQIDWWRGSWKEALEHARQRNVPLVIAVIQDGEEANERLADGVLVDKKFVAAMNEAVPIICSRENHGHIKIEKGVGEIEVCKRFGGTTCDRHIDHEVEMFRHFFHGDQVKTPQVMFCRPDLHMLDNIIDVEPASNYVKMLEKTQKQIGPGLTAKLFDDSREMLTRGRNHLRMKEYRQAWDAVAELVAVGGKATAVRRAEEIHKSVEEVLNKKLEEAYARADRGELLAALIALDDLMTDFDGTPPEKKAKAAFDRLRKSKEGRAAARDLARDKKLRPDLERAAEYETKGEWVRARDLYRRIVDRGEGLPVGLKARARLDYFASDPDIKKLLEQADGD